MSLRKDRIRIAQLKALPTIEEREKLKIERERREKEQQRQFLGRLKQLRELQTREEHLTIILSGNLAPHLRKFYHESRKEVRRELAKPSSVATPEASTSPAPG